MEERKKQIKNVNNYTTNTTEKKRIQTKSKTTTKKTKHMRDANLLEPPDLSLL